MERRPELAPAGHGAAPGARPTDGTGKLLRPEREWVGAVDVDPPSLLSSQIRSPRAPIAAARLADWVHSSRIELRVLRFRLPLSRAASPAMTTSTAASWSSTSTSPRDSRRRPYRDVLRRRALPGQIPVLVISSTGKSTTVAHLYPLILGLHRRCPRGTPPRRRCEAAAATRHRRAGRSRSGVPAGRGIDRMRWLPSGGVRTGRRPRAGERWREGGGGEGTWCRGGAAAEEEAGRRRQRRGRSHRTRFEKQDCRRQLRGAEQWRGGPTCRRQV
ncbi:unnamed protein product [Urochloa humidicola]